jgi:hypothetical protein
VPAIEADLAVARETVAAAADRDSTWLYRVGGVSALLLGIGYVITFPLYAWVGAPPGGGEAWLVYSTGKTTVWWAILGLSVATDFLFVPVALALYVAIRRANNSAMLVAAGFILLFAVLDLAVTWSNYAARIRLSEHYAAATSDAQRAAYVAAAEYASAVLTSTLEGVYSIVTLSLGILTTSLVMLRGVFNKLTAYVGVATGVLGVVSVAGPLISSALGATIIVASILTTLWILLTGYRLYRLA